MFEKAFVLQEMNLLAFTCVERVCPTRIWVATSVCIEVNVGCNSRLAVEKGPTVASEPYGSTSKLCKRSQFCMTLSTRCASLEQKLEYYFKYMKRTREYYLAKKWRGWPLLVISGHWKTKKCDGDNDNLLLNFVTSLWCEHEVMNCLNNSTRWNNSRTGGNNYLQLR